MKVVIHVREILKLDSHIPECSKLISVLCWIKRRLSLLVSGYMRQERKKKALEVRDERKRDIVLFQGQRSTKQLLQSTKRSFLAMHTWRIKLFLELFKSIRNTNEDNLWQVIVSVTKNFWRFLQVLNQ